MEVALDFVLPLRNIDSLLKRQFPNVHTLLTVITDGLSDESEVLVRLEYLKELNFAAEEQFVEGFRLLLEYESEFDNFDLLEQSEIFLVEGEFVEVEAVGGEVAEL